jgi:hypothetical protein
LSHDVPVAPSFARFDVCWFFEAAKDGDTALAKGYDLFGRDGGIERGQNRIVALEILGRRRAAFEPRARRELVVLTITCRQAVGRATRDADFDMVRR